MNPVTDTILLLMVTALVIVLAGRRAGQTFLPPAPAPVVQESQSGGVAGLIVILGVMILLVLTH